jgi:hypothetical protein
MSRYARYKRERRRRGCMRKLVFEPYEKPGDDERAPMGVRIWAALFQAVNNPQWRAADDPVKLRAAARMLDKLDTVTETTTTAGGQRATHLKYAGGDVLLEDAEFALLEDAFKAFRPTVPASMARELVAAMDFLSSAPTVETK